MGNRIGWTGIIIIALLFTGLAGFKARENRWQEQTALLQERLNRLEPQRPIEVPASWVALTADPIDLADGKPISYRSLEINDRWRRPVYVPVYHSTARRDGRFSAIPRLLRSAQHRVFYFDGGGSAWFDLCPRMGFTETTAPVGIGMKRPEEAVFVILGGRVQRVVSTRAGTVLVLVPRFTGFQLIAVPRAALGSGNCWAAAPGGEVWESPEGYRNSSTQ